MSRFSNQRTKLDCSLFWQCDSEARACLEECGHCDPGPSDPLVCDGQPALTFDSSYQHPLGPVCDWPFNTQCPVVCDTSLEQYECCHWDDCDNGGFCWNYHCLGDATTTLPPDQQTGDAEVLHQQRLVYAVSSSK